MTCSNGMNGTKVPRRPGLLTSRSVGIRTSAPKDAIGVMVCCTTGAADAAATLDSKVRALDANATLTISDDPETIRRYLARERRPCVVVVLKTAATGHGVVAALVREFALRRGADERLVIREWTAEPEAEALILGAVRSSVANLEERFARVAPTRSSVRVFAAPRALASGLLDADGFRAGESTDSWAAPIEKDPPVHRRVRVWSGFAVAMLITVLVVLSLHHLRSPGGRRRPPAVGPQTMSEDVLERARRPSVGRPSAGRPSLDAVAELVRHGDVHILDLEVATSPGVTSGARGTASERCEALRLGPWTDWRLATEAEVQRFGAAELLPEGTYWIRTDRSPMPIRRAFGGVSGASTASEPSMPLVVCTRALSANATI